MKFEMMKFFINTTQGFEFWRKYKSHKNSFNDKKIASKVNSKNKRSPELDICNIKQKIIHSRAISISNKFMPLEMLNDC